MAELNLVDTTDTSEATEGRIRTPYYAVRTSGYNYNGTDGYLEYGTGTPGSLPFRVDQSGNVIAASVTGANGTVDWLNVKQYGTNAAAGTAINAAIAALPSTGGVVYVPAGTWTLDTAVLWSVNNLVIVGDGWSTQIVFDGSAIPTAFKMADTTNRTIIMRDLRILQSNAASAGTAIDASYCQNSKFTNLRITSVTAPPLKGIIFNAIASYYNLISDSRIECGGSGSVCISFDSISNSNVVRNVRLVGDSSGNTKGVYVNANGIELDHVDMESHALIGIHLDSLARNITIINPYLETLTTGIQLEANSGPATMINGDLLGCTAAITDNGCLGFSARNYWTGSTNTASYDTSIGGTKSVIKPTDQTVNNSNALANDSALTLPVLASASYAVKCWVIYDSGTTPDIQFAFTGPSGATMNWTTNALGTPAAGGTGSVTVTRSALGSGNPLPAGGIGAGSKVIANLEGILQVSSTAGSLQLEWAQNTADPSNTVVRAASYLELTRLS